ncbi:MAG: dihydropteroate synthase [Alphaproteobacteria bacterium]
MTQTKIVGILNLTPDSFSDGGKFFDRNLAIAHLKKMLSEQASVIDIGAESTRPNAQILDDNQEFSRLENILPEIVFHVKEFNKKYQKQVKTSIDSYHFTTIVKSYEIGVDIVNDVSGLIDQRIINFIAKNNITTILMHNLAIHANPSLVINVDLNINQEIINWARAKIKDLENFGVRKSQLIFDPGIGFAKNARQSLRIIKNIEQYRVLGLPLYVGHSKKSFLDALDIEADRSSKTIQISKYLAQKQVDYIRVHDVLENYLAITKI